MAGGVPERSGGHSSGPWDTPRLLMGGAGFCSAFAHPGSPLWRGEKWLWGLKTGSLFFFFSPNKEKSAGGGQ